MKFNVPSKALQAQLTAVSKVINSKNALSILDNFLLTLSGETLSIMGSDSENTMIANLQVFDAEGEGLIAINAKRLLDVLKEVAGQPLTFVINDDTKEVDIRFMNGHFNFMGINGNEFPRKDEAPADAKTFTLPAEVHMVRAFVRPGKQNIRLVLRDGYGNIVGDRVFENVRVKRGGRVFLHVRTAY